MGVETTLRVQPRSANALSRYCALSFDYFVSTQQK